MSYSKMLDELNWTLPRKVEVEDIKGLALYELNEDLEIAKNNEDDEEIAKIEKLLKVVEAATRPEDFRGYFGDRDEITEMITACEEYQTEAAELENLCYQYSELLAEIAKISDFKINYSRKSRSIYLTCELSATEEAVEELLDLSNYFDCCNTYDDYESYSENENICIRISDHDFGGRWDAATEVDYSKSCINYVLK